VKEQLNRYLKRLIIVSVLCIEKHIVYLLKNEKTLSMPLMQRHCDDLSSSWNIGISIKQITSGTKQFVLLKEFVQNLAKTNLGFLNVVTIVK